MRLLILFIFLAASIPEAFAQRNWYWGEVTQVNTLKGTLIVEEGTNETQLINDGSFEVRINHPDLIENCRYNTIRVLASEYGPERTKSAMSIALAAFMGGKQLGVVIELPETLDYCYAAPEANQGIGIK